MAESSSEKTPEHKAYQEYLENNGFEWYLEHDCVQDDLMKSIITNLPPDAAKPMLENHKQRIEKDVERMKAWDSNLPLNDKPYNCVLIGKTGAGKSSLGNLLIGRDAFDVGHTQLSQTKTIRFKSSANIHIIDTPGFGDSDEKVDAALELTKIFDTFKEGIHAFVYVFEISNPRISKEDQIILNLIKDTLGESFLSHAVLVFTKSESHFKTNKTKTLREFIAGYDGTDFGKIIRNISCEGELEKAIAVENSATGYQRGLFRDGVLQLVQFAVESCIKDGHTMCYKHEYFIEASEQLELKQLRRREERTRREDEIREMIRTEVEKELSELDPHRMLVLATDESRRASTVAKLVKVRINVTDEYQSFTENVAQKALGDRLLEKCQEQLKAAVDRTVNRHDKGQGQFIWAIKRHHLVLVEVVGEKTLQAFVAKRLQELEEENDRTESQKRKLAFQKQVRKVTIDNIKLHDKTSELCDLLPASDFGRNEMLEMLDNFLSSDEGRERIKKYTTRAEEERKVHALHELRVATSRAVGERVAHKDRAELVKLRENQDSLAYERGKIEKAVRESLAREHLECLPYREIPEHIRDALDDTLKTLTDRSILQMIKDIFAKILGLK